MFYTQRYPGEIASRVELNDSVANLLSNELAINILNIFQVFFFLFIMIQYDVVLTMVAISIAVVNVAVLILISKKRKNENIRLLQATGKLMGTTMGGLSSIETLKATGRESDFFEMWCGYEAKMINSMQKIGLVITTMNVVPTLLATLATTLVLSIGSLRIMNGELTIGMFIAFQMVMVLFLAPITSLVELGTNL